MPPKRHRDEEDEFAKLEALLAEPPASKRPKTKHTVPILHGTLMNVVSHKKKSTKRAAPAFGDFVGPMISIPSQTVKKKTKTKK